MGLFSGLSSLFKSGNGSQGSDKGEFQSSHQQHLKNVENRGIKVIEIQKRGTSSSMVEVPVELARYTQQTVGTILSNYPNKVVVQTGTKEQDVAKLDSLIKVLSTIAEKALLWSVRDANFYEELAEYDLRDAWVSSLEVLPYTSESTINTQVCVRPFVEVEVV